MVFLEILLRNCEHQVDVCGVNTIYKSSGFFGMQTRGWLCQVCNIQGLVFVLNTLERL